MRKLFYLAWWYFQVRFLNKKKPLQTVLFINNECNLRCKHCCIDKDSQKIKKSYEQIKEELEYSYKLGSRFVDFEGGEPTLWKEKDNNINDLILLAKKIGFFSTTVTTNAQNDFSWLNTDSIWVSIDGFEKYHDSIRGENSFKKAIENIEKYGKTGKNNLSINMVINSLNEKSVEDTIKFAKNNPYINSISLNFHMPYFDTENLCTKNKNEIIDRIIELKKQGYPIMNTFNGLKNLKKSQNGKYCWITNFIMPNGEKLNQCQGKENNMCENCGLGMATEMKNIYNFSLETIFAGIKLRLLKNKKFKIF